MSTIDCLVILLLLTLMALSGLLCAIIHNHIKRKRLIDKTIVDLVYQDCIFYIFCTMISFSAAFIQCLSSADLTIDFWSALVYSVLIYLFIGCLASSTIASSSLRLLTLVKMSEEAGIQVLGSDDRAIRLIRLTSFFTSSGFIFAAIIMLNSFPPAIPILMGLKDLPFIELLRQDVSSLLYFTLPTVGFILNIIVSIVSCF